MSLHDVEQKLKFLMIQELHLEGRTPDSIDSTAPLFGEGLGLDSLDALQLAMMVEEHFRVRVPEGEESRSIFASISALAQFILKEQPAV